MKPITFRIPPEVLDAVDSLAKSEGRSRSAMIVTILRERLATLPAKRVPRVK